jgi:hypothetical protein
MSDPGVPSETQVPDSTEVGTFASALERLADMVQRLRPEDLTPEQRALLIQVRDELVALSHRAHS